MLSIDALMQAAISGILMGGVYGLLSSGLCLIFGVMEMVNFAHGQLVMMGMYTTYWLFVLFRMDPILSLIITMPIFFVLGLLVESFLVERMLKMPAFVSGLAQMSLMIGLALILENTALFFWSANFRSVTTSYSDATIRLVGLFISVSRLVAFVAAVIITFVLTVFLKFSDQGLALRATIQDKEAAQLMGINIKRMRMLAWGLGAALAGGAGSIITLYIYIYPTIGFDFIITMFIIVTLGGLRSFTGSFVGGIIIGLSESLSVMFLPLDLRELVPFTLFILVLMYKPEGLFGRGRI